MASTLNDNIKTLRVSQGMNQVQFAKLLGVTKQCVSNWENDNVLPSIDMLIKIADVFGVSTDCVLGRTETVSVDISELTEAQRGHIILLVNDLSEANKKNSAK